MDQPQSRQSDELDYEVSISEILKQAWERINGAKGTIWIAFAILMVISFVISLVFRLSSGSAGMDYGMGYPTHGTGMTGLIEGLVKLFITLPLGAGLAMIGIKLAANVPVEWSEVLNYFGRVLPLVGATLLMYLLIFIGICLLVLPGIYLAFAYSLTIPLMVERGLSPWEAMETSRKAVTKHWFALFGLYLVTGLIILVSMIPLGLGLIWTLPMGVLVNGIVYRTIFGYESEQV